MEVNRRWNHKSLELKPTSYYGLSPCAKTDSPLSLFPKWVSEASGNANSVKTTAASRKKEQSSVVKVDLGGTWLIGHQKGHT